MTITADTYSHLLEGVGKQAAEAAAAMVPRANRGAEVQTMCEPEAENETGLPPHATKDQFGGGAPPGTRTPDPLIKSQLL